MTAVTLTQMIAESRIIEIQNAVIATLKPRYPDLAIKGHPGKIDISDIVAGNVFNAPAIAVAVTRVHPDERLSEAFDLPISFTAYVIVENRAVAGKSVLAEELGWAICLRLMRDLHDVAIARWGLQDIDFPAEIDARPLFTAKSFDKGTLYYSVTWRQVPLGAGARSGIAYPGGNWSIDP